MIRIDARGKSCPKPVMMTKEAVDQGAAEVEVLVDNPVAAGNVTRFLEGRGFRVTREDTPEGTLISGIAAGSVSGGAGSAPKGVHDASVSSAPGEQCCCTASDTGLLILSRTMGTESLELGEALMKAFLDTMRQSGSIGVLALMNGGVFLALPESSASDTIREMEAQGTQVLVCGTCTKHFGITDQVAVGTISNMFEITEQVFRMPKTVTIG
ncbi:selenium metabolism protein YedF [Thermanaerovibrio velox DSM 12556]|uniref:Selenium metabolism protein YedF n=1 Tax=Thermanaerovibrio velox DSM 12556 TaxID=926567 RepID=H0UPU7_9BACT|nr:sulfurtransferase-like selenium metabolism protein YedF [Thermanaerovibrio velox]EHM10656.1 selenium metabolism protein YedF [Thermanaerovibrio velox DSM 12556]